MGDSDIHSEIENLEAEEPKSKEKKKKAKSSSSDSSEDEWIEKDVMESVAEGRRVLSDESEEDIIGPVLPQKVQLSHKELGTQLLKGEGEAMAAYIAEGK